MTHSTPSGNQFLNSSTAVCCLLAQEPAKDSRCAPHRAQSPQLGFSNSSHHLAPASDCFHCPLIPRPCPGRGAAASSVSPERACQAPWALAARPSRGYRFSCVQGLVPIKPLPELLSISISTCSHLPSLFCSADLKCRFRGLAASVCELRLHFRDSCPP